MTSTNGWPLVPLGELLTKNERMVSLVPAEKYREVTIRLWGKGVVLRRMVTGAEIAAERRFCVAADQFIVSRIDARNGAMGVVPTELDGAVVTNDFPSFESDRGKLLPAFLGWLSKTPAFVDMCRAASEGTTNRVRLKEDRFLQTPIPLPSLEVQRRIVARIDHLAAKLDESSNLARKAEAVTDSLLFAAHHKIAESAPREPFGEVAPLTRRPAVIDTFAEYPQISVRSFGKGTFHNPPLLGSEITWQKPFLVKRGDILVSNIKAWEGAIAVAGPDDDGRYGSHRYLTFVPTDGVATAHFLCFHLLSPEGLYHVGEASPGSADRNRTLSAKAMLEIPVPVPRYKQQLWFDRIWSRAVEVRELRHGAAAARDAMLPAILDRAFKGELS
ncbi:MAG: restriction endonuclease subunit S [Phycisphaerae bacterium]|nr:restriction endonuclease subunit S [Phycisphaerae bacterium]